MAWFTRFTRFGDMHFVFGQERGNTCGIASVMMCVLKINKLAPGTQALYLNSRIRELYGNWLGQTYEGHDDGTWPAGLVHVLNGLNCGRWTHENVAPTDAPQRIIDLVGSTSGLGPTVNVKPVIVAVNWDGSTASHWVCIDTVRSIVGRNYATICDPWDANVHVQRITPGQEFVYEAAETFHVDFGGSHFNYSQPSTGRVRVWPIIHLT